MQFMFSQIANSQHQVHLFYTTNSVENSRNQTMRCMERGVQHNQKHIFFLLKLGYNKEQVTKQQDKTSRPN